MNAIVLVERVPAMRHVSTTNRLRRGSGPRATAIAVVAVAAWAILSIAPALAAGATISGKVTSEGGGGGIEGICVTVFDETGFEEIEFAETDGEGDYAAEVPPGHYKVVFFDCNEPPSYVEEWWDDKPDGETADIVDTTDGTPDDEIDAELEMGETISGQVTSDGAHGIGEICVDVVRLSGENDIAGFGFTDEKGKYAAVVPTSPNEYKVVFYDCRLEPGPEYVEQWWNEKPDFASADVVDVTDGSPDEKIDAVLELESEPEPEDESDSDSGSSPAPAPTPAAVPVLPPAVPPGQGLARAVGVAQVRGNKALLRLRCPGLAPCRGIAKLVVRVKTKPKRGAKRSRRRVRKRVRNVVIGKSRFSIPAGGGKTIRVRLNGAGKRLLRRSGRRGFKATLVGRGVKRRAVKLKPKAQRRGKKRGQRRSR